MFRLVALVLLVIAALFFAGTQLRLESKANADFSLRWTLESMGVIIAILSASGLLLQCFIAAVPDRVPPLLIATLAGLMLYNQNWMVAAALSAACLAVVLPVFRRG